MITYIDLKKWFFENSEKINESIIRDIFSIDNGIVFEIYKKNIEKPFLYLIPGEIIFLSDKKIEKKRKKISLKLKKDFLNKKIYIFLEDDKIIRIESNNKKIYIELIPNGFFVVTDNNDNILYANLYKNLGYRKIYKGEKYVKPIKNFELPEKIEDFVNLIKKTNKKDIVRFLAIDIGLSGKYAEYILNSISVDKTKNPRELNYDEILKIFEKYKEILEKKEVLYNNQWYSDINLLFEKIFFDKKIEEEIKKIKRKREYILKILNEQKEKLDKIIKEIELTENFANFVKNNYWIFENYDIEKIRNFLLSTTFNIEVEKKDNKIIFKIKDS